MKFGGGGARDARITPQERHDVQSVAKQASWLRPRIAARRLALDYRRRRRVVAFCAADVGERQGRLRRCQRRPGVIAALGNDLHGALDRDLHQRVLLVGPLPGFEPPFLLGCELRPLGNLGLSTVPRAAAKRFAVPVRS